MSKTQNLNVKQYDHLVAPKIVKAEIPAEQAAIDTVVQARQGINEALEGSSNRLVVITGPCSIHDTDAAMEYAEKLAAVSKNITSTIQVVMRVYFEKPRTTVGWKGLINDPSLDGTHDVEVGLRKARRLLRSINQLGLPCATEFLDPIVPQYISDLISWAAIGARTTESQTHREMASGLSMPVGFKNATDGGLQVAVNAMQSAEQPHVFLGIDDTGTTSVIRTRGNRHVHIVLRGGESGPNFSKAHVAYTKVLLEKTMQPRPIMVDCSHANSKKDFRKQPAVFQDVLRQFKDGEESILGMMLESHLNAGQQKLGKDLDYGVSITDGCIDWQETEKLLQDAHKILRSK